MRTLLLLLFITISSYSQTSRPRYEDATVNGTTTYTLTHGTVLPLNDGLTYSVIFTNAPGGASTLRVNGLVLKPLVDASGNDLTSSSFTAGFTTDIRYDAGSDKWKLVAGTGGGSGTVLGVVNGGTGLNTIAQGRILYGSASNVISGLAHPTAASRILRTSSISNIGWSSLTWPDIVSTGSLIYASSSSALSQFSIGSDGDILTASGGTISWAPPSGLTLASSTYTPGLTNTTNVAASTAYVTGYYRIGNSVTVFGKIDIDATLAASSATELQIDLPIASNFTGEQDLGGTAISDAIASLTARIKGDATTDKASVVFKALSLSNDSYSFEFSYQVK